MTMSAMRRIVTEQYPNETWKEKVKRMSDSQVMAIYFRMKEERKG